MKLLNRSSLILLIFLSPIVLLNSCKKEIEKSILSLNITKHPEGGFWLFEDHTADLRTAKNIYSVKFTSSAYTANEPSQ